VVDGVLARCVVDTTWRVVEAARRESAVDVDLDWEALPVLVGLDGILVDFLQLGTRPDGASAFRAFFGVGLKRILRLFKVVMIPETKQSLTLHPVQCRVQPSASGHPN
jgi:hypothetical protein